MRTTREQANATRERIIETAGRLFREKGFDGIGVADLMKGAGLTHGGFYSHFDSKEDLMAATCARALDQSLSTWQAHIDKEPARALETITRSYLSTRHRDRPDGTSACVVAADGTDITRLGESVRHAATQGIEKQLALLETLVPGRTRAVRRKRALATYASLLGGLLLARIVDDPKLSTEVLGSVADTVIA